MRPPERAVENEDTPCQREKTEEPARDNSARARRKLMNGREDHGLFTTSPTFAEPEPLKVPVAESLSASVTVISPTLSSTDLMTLPVAGSFTTRTCREIVSLSPTFTPAFFPTLTISVLPETSATRPFTSSLIVGTFSTAESSCVPVSSTALCTASPRIVLAKLLLPMSSEPPPPPLQPPPPPRSDVLERVDSPAPVTAATISPVDVLTIRALMPTTALALLVPTPPRPNLPSP